MTASGNLHKNAEGIVSNKGIGINEQNIIQIICKPPDNSKDSDAELLRIYKQQLESKDHEIKELKEKLTKFSQPTEPQPTINRRNGSLSTAIMKSYNKARCKSQCNFLFFIIYRYQNS